MKSLLPARRLIPKWRAVAKTLATHEVSPTSPRDRAKVVPEPSEVDAALRAWRENPGAGQLGELLALSVFPECEPQVAGVVQEALSLGIEMTVAQKTFVGLNVDGDRQRVLDVRDEYFPGGARLRALRAALKENPANPLALLDIAQLKLAWGDRQAADRALRTAMSLLPNNVLALRTYARYLVHIGDKERAHALIQRHPRTPRNPWLLASEIALAEVAERAPSFFGAGRRLVKDGRLPPSEITELAGALGAHEMSAGRHRLARDFFLSALQSPNDNVAAQAITDERSIGISLETAIIRSAIEGTSEASAIAAFHRGDVLASINAADHWFGEEPFSSRPVQFLGWLHIHQGEFDRASKIITCGLRADPDDVNLLINLSYALAASGKQTEAIAVGRRALNKDRNASEPFFKATVGLILMQSGLFDEGDSRYREATEYFGRLRDFQRQALCLAYQAQSALMTGHPKALERLDEAMRAGTKFPSPDGALMLAKLTGSAPSAEVKSTNRRTEQWVYHPTTNVLEKISGLTKPGAAAIVWADK